MSGVMQRIECRTAKVGGTGLMLILVIECVGKYADKSGKIMKCSQLKY